jgi:hypothetical protein
MRPTMRPLLLLLVLPLLLVTLLLLPRRAFASFHTLEEMQGSKGGDAENVAEDIDANAGLRFRYLNSTNLTMDWETSCTGFRPVCRIFDLLDNGEGSQADATIKTVGEQGSLGEMHYWCTENRLEKDPIYLSAGASWESTYIVWIASILIRELLQIPVVIRQNMDSFHNFYPARTPVTGKWIEERPPLTDDSLNKIDASRFDALEIANAEMSCGYVQPRPTITRLIRFSLIYWPD